MSVSDEPVSCIHGPGVTERTLFVRWQQTDIPFQDTLTRTVCLKEWKQCALKGNGSEWMTLPPPNPSLWWSEDGVERGADSPSDTSSRVTLSPHVTGCPPRLIVFPLPIHSFMVVSSSRRLIAPLHPTRVWWHFFLSYHLHLYSLSIDIASFFP